MKRICAALLALMTGAAAPPAAAHELETCIATDDAGPPVCHHYFEGPTAVVPIDEALRGIDADCEQLTARILQRQGLLLAPLSEAKALAAEDCATMSVSVNLPDVRAETDILLQLSAEAPAAEQPAAVVTLRVYPDTLLDPLASLAERRPLVVFDSQGRLTRLFDDAGIDYVERLPSMRGEPIAILVAPREPERLLEDRGVDTAVIFREKIIDLPQVRTVSKGGSTRVYVEMRLLDEIHTNPLAQKALLNIINLAINPNPTDRG